LAAECNAVNLGQVIFKENMQKIRKILKGFPDSPMPSFLARHMQEVAKCPERTDFHQVSVCINILTSLWYSPENMGSKK
jgi:hypothetical protein